MFVRVVHIHYDPAAATHVLDFTPDRFALAFQRLSSPFFVKLPGFIDATTGSDHDSGQILSITRWDTRAQALQVRASLGAITARFNEFGIVFGEPEIYEVKEDHGSHGHVEELLKGGG